MSDAPARAGSTPSGEVTAFERGLGFFLGGNLIAISGIVAFYALVGLLGDAFDFISPNRVLYTWLAYGMLGGLLGAPLSVLASVGLLIARRPRIRLHLVISFSAAAVLLLLSLIHSELM